MIALFDRPMDEETVKSILRQYRESVSNVNTRLLRAECSDGANHFKTPTDYASQLASAIKLPKKEGEKEEKSLELSSESKEKLNAALSTPTKDIEAAIKKFQDGVAALKTMSVQSLAVLQSDLKKDMSAVHQVQKQQLEAFFETDQFKEDIKKSGMDLDHAKGQFKSELDTAQKKQVRQFDHAVAQDEARQLEVLNRAEANVIIANSKWLSEFKTFLADKREAARNAAAGAALQATTDEKEGETYSEADVAEFFKSHAYQTRFGKDISVSPDGKSLKISSGQFGRQIKEEDMLEIALMAKAMGWTEIHVHIEHDDPIKAKALASQQFRKCLAVGLDPKNIHVQFKGRGEKEFSKYEPTAEDLKEARLLSTSLNQAAQNQCKQSVQEVRTEGQKAAAAAHTAMANSTEGEPPKPS